MSSRDLIIRIFDLGPSRGVMVLPVGIVAAFFLLIKWLKLGETAEERLDLKSNRSHTMAHKFRH